MAEQPHDPGKHGNGLQMPADEADTRAIGDSSKKVLTPEEQLARFEEALKEEDWGHQPC